MRRVLLLLGGMAVVAGVVYLVSLDDTPPTPVSHAAADTPTYYVEAVKPILQNKCGQCHFGINHRGGLNLGTKALMMKGGRDGPVVVPGDPANSLLVKLMRHEGPAEDPMPMPPWPRRRVSDGDIAIVERWIQAGAVMPEDVPVR